MIPVYICKAKNDMVIKHDKIHENEAFLLTTTKKGLTTVAIKLIKTNLL